MTHSPHASQRQVDLVMAAELAAALVALGILAPTALTAAGAAASTAAAALLLRRHRGSTASAVGLTLLLTAAVLALVMVLPALPATLLLLPLVLMQLPVYQRWPLVLGIGALFTLAPYLLPASATAPGRHAFAAFLLVQTLYLVHAARERARHARALFDVEFLVLAMGRDGRIRLDLDVLRAETATGQRLKDVQERVARTLQQVHQAAHAATAAALSLQANGRELTERTQSSSRELGDMAISLEQVAVIVKDSADAALAARQTAQAATALAEEGSGIVSQMVGQMQAIDGSSRRITDIIGVIDGIAFQTNLLALNAAVEAARAGHHGRGFAVVAAEVRSLAQRVSQAAAEVKTLIDESVNATSRGSALATAAGGTMSRLTQAVTQVDTTFHSLSADTNEHAAGLVAMRDTMYQLRDAQRQNLMLAEQSQQIADLLTERARALDGALAGFRLAGGDVAAAPAASSEPARAERPPAAERPTAPATPPARPPAAVPVTTAATPASTESASSEVEFF